MRSDLPKEYLKENDLDKKRIFFLLFSINWWYQRLLNDKNQEESNRNHTVIIFFILFNILAQKYHFLSLHPWITSFLTRVGVNEIFVGIFSRPSRHVL